MKKNVLAKVFVLAAVALLALACTKDNSNEKKVAVLYSKVTLKTVDSY